MEAGRKMHSLRLKEKSQPHWTVNCSVSARNLRKSDLGAVIFGCKHSTITECKINQLFGLPASHFSYVKNVSPGLTLFLFNYSDRKLHGIFEAASPGQLNINPYGWTGDGAGKTPYPAQVRVGVQKQCCPLLEKQFAPIIADNYYEQKLFWFELDHTQARKLIDLFLSFPLPNVPPSMLNADKWNTIFNATPSYDTKEAGGNKDAGLEDLFDDMEKMDMQQGAWGASKKEMTHASQMSYATMLATNTSLGPDRTWSSLFTNSTVSDTKQRKEMLKKQDLCKTLKTQASKSLHQLDESNVELESTQVAFSSNRHGQHFEASTYVWGAEEYEEPFDWKSNYVDSSMLATATDSIPVNTSHGCVPSINLSEDGGCFKSVTSDLHLHQSHEPKAEWEIPCLTYVSGGESEHSEASCDNDAEAMLNDVTKYVKGSVGNHDSDTVQHFLIAGENTRSTESSVVLTVGEFKSFDFQSLVAELMQEIGELKDSQSRQNLKISSLEQELVQSKVEILQLKNQYNMLASRPTSSSCGRFEELDFESFLPALESDNSILLVGGYNGSCWLSDLSYYSPSHDRMKSLKPMTFFRSYTSAAKLNGELYLFGGVHGDVWYDTVESYSPTCNEWYTRPSLNQKKGSLAGVSLFEKLFAIGGGNGVECFSEVEMLDLNIGKWIFTQSMQKKRFAPAVAEINGTLYVAGGYDGQDYLNSVERFDSREHKWSITGSMNTRRGCHSLIALNGKLYAVGGYEGTKMVSTVEVFDPRVGSWMRGESMKDARGYSDAVAIGEKIYVIGGVKDSEKILDTIECYKEGCGWQVTDLQAVGKRCFFSALVL